MTLSVFSGLVGSEKEEEVEEVQNVLKSDYRFTEPIPRFRSMYPTPEVLERASAPLVQVYKSFLIRSALLLGGPTNLVNMLPHYLKTIAPFGDVHVHRVRVSGADPGQSESSIDRIRIDDKLHACHWYPPGTNLCETIFKHSHGGSSDKGLPFQTEGHELPLVWFQFSCKTKNDHLDWNICDKDQFVMLVLRIAEDDANVPWKDTLVQSICNTPIPEPATIKAMITNLSGTSHIIRLKKKHPGLCEFSIGLYRAILQLALPEQDQVVSPAPKAKDDNKTAKEKRVKREPSPEGNVTESIRQDRLKAEQLRVALEEKRRTQEERQREREERERERERVLRLQDLEPEPRRLPATQQRKVISIKPKPKKGNNKKGLPKPKSQQNKVKPGKAYEAAQPKKNKQSGYLPRVSSGTSSERLHCHKL